MRRIRGEYRQDARPCGPDPVFEIADKAPNCHAMTLGSSWIRFAAPPMVGGWTEIGLPSELLWPDDAALEQSIARSPELGSAAAFPVSVSRHLVSTSVQFGQSHLENKS